MRNTAYRCRYISCHPWPVRLIARQLRLSRSLKVQSMWWAQEHVLADTSKTPGYQFNFYLYKCRINQSVCDCPCVNWKKFNHFCGCLPQFLWFQLAILTQQWWNGDVKLVCPTMGCLPWIIKVDFPTTVVLGVITVQIPASLAAKSIQIPPKRTKHTKQHLHYIQDFWNCRMIARLMHHV